MENPLPTLDKIFGEALIVVNQDCDLLFDSNGRYELTVTDVLEAIQNWVDEYGEAV